MFENIRIEAERGAPEHYIGTGSVYFRSIELQKLHNWTTLLPSNFAPSKLPSAVLLNSKGSVEEEFQRVGLDGKYFWDEQPTIHLRYDDLNGYARAVFWHEYRHHIWFSLNVEFQAEWREIQREILSSTSYQEALDLDNLVSTRYFTLPKEVWARLFSQFLLLYVGDMEAWTFLANIPEGFWTREDVSRFAPMIIALLAKNQFNATAIR
jgi:hypothetical protein